MKKYLFFLYLFLSWSLTVHSQSQPDYSPLDAEKPIYFAGDYLVYQNDTLLLGPKAFFVDGQLTEAEVRSYPYVFNSIQSAVEQLTNGTEEAPMTLYIAPWVYWIDDPDDPAIRIPEEGDYAPYGMKIKCDWLTFYGLSDDPKKVVLACNRGQTIGAKGNFTMFRFYGDGTRAENITFGNYCNVDLAYPLKPELSREKRATAIVQAQLIHCDGDKIVARNTHFISRLNLCPFVGGKRILFDRCHFESTDDALSGTAVYLNSTLEFYSSKPFYRTTGTGAVFLNCDIRSFTNGRQYFTKANGQVAVVDTRFKAADDLYFGWRDTPPKTIRNYQYNVSLNDRSLQISTENPDLRVDMQDRPVLDAYRIQLGEKVIYNTYNLLRGEDDWDPMGVKPVILKAEKVLGKRLTQIPVQLSIQSTQDQLETGKNTAQLSVRLLRFGNFEIQPEKIDWKLSPGSEAYAILRVKDENGLNCELIPTNESNTRKEVVVVASTPSGLEAAVVVQVDPRILPPPAFLEQPTLSKITDGKLAVDYQLETAFQDQSQVSWYRCTKADGSGAIEVAVSRQGNPLKEYELTHGDVGYFLKVVVKPKHIRSEIGEGVTVITHSPIRAGQVTADPNVLHPDFFKLSTRNQPEVLPGFWTMRQLPSLEEPRTNDAWWYGIGRDGAREVKGLLQGRSGFLSFTPVAKKSDAMKLTLQVAPFKSAGQGFSVAPLYMDVLLKFDAKTMTGYGLRIIRTTKYGNAVDFLFVKYDNGKVTEISEPVSASCYRTICTITLEYQDQQLKATAATDSQYDKSNYSEEVLSTVSIHTPVKSNDYGGLGIWYEGGASAVIKDLVVEWEN